MTRDERNVLVLALLEYVTPILRKSASVYNLDYEDLRQDASLTIISMLDRNEIDFSLSTAHQYVRFRVRSRIVDRLRYVSRRVTCSLDALVSEQEGAATLADLLPSPYCVEPLTILVAQERIQELSPMLIQRNPSRARAIRERWDTALALCEVPR
jgi:hypothetical protein